MDFLKKTFSVNLNDWKPESLEEKAVRENNVAVVRDSILDTMNGNDPFIINYEGNGVRVAQFVASGAIGFTAAPLNENTNWVNFGFPGQLPARTFTNQPDRLFCDNRAGNDARGVDNKDPLHSMYHGHTSNGRFPISLALTPTKRNLSEVGKGLSRSLFDKYAEENFIE